MATAADTTTAPRERYLLARGFTPSLAPVVAPDPLAPIKRIGQAMLAALSAHEELRRACVAAGLGSVVDQLDHHSDATHDAIDAALEAHAKLGRN